MNEKPRKRNRNRPLLNISGSSGLYANSLDIESNIVSFYVVSQFEILISGHE